ncbi:MAG TPA: phosphate ABC transporter substrate-binding protein PstS, partial [Geobacteraceae bacterium]|nr:phosphate ABC transporter substrate-binding protein PstS [Geobacteraceae bacterium]
MFEKIRKSILAVVLAMTVTAAGAANADTLINGAGATFPYPLYSKWFSEYAKVDPTVKFNYQSIGSGGGIKQITAQTVDFGASDKFLSDDELKAAPGKLLHIPTVMGAVVVTYNIPGISTGLKLKSEDVAEIFLGKITKWNDKRIADDNPGIKLPDQPIIVVHRSDGSGTSSIFTDYLSGVSPEWAKSVGKGASVKWPVGLGGKGNEGVAGQVKTTRYT